MIDTHSHIYSEEFDADSDYVIQSAKSAGVEHIILPNVDKDSLPRLLELVAQHPNYCYPCIGIHPTSIDADFETELKWVKSELDNPNYIALGEIGIDLHWDKTYFEEQKIAFAQQIEWALAYKLPVIIHVRDSFRETMTLLDAFKNKGLEGVFHSFTGSVDEAKEIIDFGGFKLGINGIVTFKNSGLAQVLEHIELEHILLETDSPYLTPTPHRGKRNESSYIKLICDKLALVYKTHPEEIDIITTENALKLFRKIQFKKQLSDFLL